MPFYHFHFKIIDFHFILSNLHFRSENKLLFFQALKSDISECFCRFSRIVEINTQIQSTVLFYFILQYCLKTFQYILFPFILISTLDHWLCLNITDYDPCLRYNRIFPEEQWIEYRKLSLIIGCQRGYQTSVWQVWTDTFLVWNVPHHFISEENVCYTMTQTSKVRNGDGVKQPATW